LGSFTASVTTDSESISVSGSTGPASAGTLSSSVTVDSESANFTGSTSSEGGSFTASVSVDSEGSSGANKNLPPYYALCFIMKT